MESYRQLFINARKACDTADHLTYVTYPLLKESKLMITITNHIHQALQNAMQALFEYEKMYKRISYIPNDFMSKMHMLRTSILPRYKIQDYTKLMINVRNVMEEKKKSSMEFSRNDRYYFYSSDYIRASSISMDSIKESLAKTKLFLENLDGLLGVK